MTPDTVKKLIDAFSNGMTDEEACLYADISKPTLYDYCDLHPEFSSQKELLKKKPNLKAKLNLVRKINETDIEASKRWLERKNKEEFSTKQEVDNKHSGAIITTEVPLTDQQQKILAEQLLESLKRKDLGSNQIGTDV